MNNFAHTAGGRAGYTSGTPRRMIVVRSCAARLSHGLSPALARQTRPSYGGGGIFHTPSRRAGESGYTAQGENKSRVAVR